MRHMNRCPLPSCGVTEHCFRLPFGDIRHRLRGMHVSGGKTRAAEIVSWLFGALGIVEAVDALVLAKSCGYVVYAGPVERAWSSGDCIVVRESSPEEQQHAFVARVVAADAIRRHGDGVVTPELVLDVSERLICPSAFLAEVSAS